MEITKIFRGLEGKEIFELLYFEKVGAFFRLAWCVFWHDWVNLHQKKDRGGAKKHKTGKMGD